jgi:hypothetical protein
MVHILAGVIGIACGVMHTYRAGLFYAWFILIVYGLVTILGFAMTPHEGMLLGMIHINAADNLLHLAISLSALAVVVAFRKQTGYLAR